MTQRQRGFELIHTEQDTTLLPERSTQHSAGYDLKCAETTTLPPKSLVKIRTGVKAYMNDNEVLTVYDRSSNYKKKGIVLINSVGIIDADYYNNDDTEGQIFLQMKNDTDETIVIPYGERIAQGIFINYLRTDTDNANGKRIGGIGSTNK